MPSDIPLSVRFAQLALLAALTAGGCAARGTTPPPSSEQVLRVYVLPEDLAEEAWKAIASAVEGGPPGSRIERLPDGRLFLIASLDFHERAETLLRAFTAHPIRSAELDYWVVLGEPGSAAVGLAGAPELEPVLQDILAEQGPMKFSLLETSRLSSMLDESANAQGNLVQVRQVVSVVGGKLVADVSIDLRIEQSGTVYHRNVQSRVNFRPGRPLVLGQSGYAGDAKPGESGPHSTVFFILRGDVLRDR